MSDIVLAKLAGADRMIAEATTEQKARKTLAFIEAMELYSRRINAGRSTQNQASRYVLLAKRNFAALQGRSGAGTADRRAAA